MSSLGDERAVCRAGSINRLKADLRGDAQQCVEADETPSLDRPPEGRRTRRPIRSNRTGPQSEVKLQTPLNHEGVALPNLR
jgi:hypothetical protein